MGLGHKREHPGRHVVTSNKYVLRRSWKLQPIEPDSRPADE